MLVKFIKLLTNWMDTSPANKETRIMCLMIELAQDLDAKQLREMADYFEAVAQLEE